MANGLLAKTRSLSETSALHACQEPALRSLRSKTNSGYQHPVKRDSHCLAAQHSQSYSRPGRLDCLSHVSAEFDIRSDEVLDPPTYIKAPGRIVAVGDIHGDAQKAFQSLALAGVLKESPRKQPVWIGGDTVVVQLGDVLDRGDNEIACLQLLQQLDDQARLEGGAVYMLNGNHESMNVSGNYRYVTEGGMRDSAYEAGYRGSDLDRRQFQLQARTQLYAPGQPIAKQLAKNPTVLIVNDTVFAHGGVLPSHVTYGLEKMNREVAAWMRGDLNPDGAFAAPPFLAMGGPDSVMWTRSFGREARSGMDRMRMCSPLRCTLNMLGVERMVVGHTPQEKGANCECNGAVWRLDVGMSSGVLNGCPQVLEIKTDPITGCSYVNLLTAQPSFALGSSRMLNSMAPFRPRSLGQVVY